MAANALFSIRRLLAMVAVIACLFAALRCANPTTLLILQTFMLGTVVVLSVLALAGAARTRRFCVAALIAGLAHWFLCYAHPLSQIALYGGTDTEGSPTMYCCNMLWNWIKVVTPMSPASITWQSYPAVPSTSYVAPGSPPATIAGTGRQIMIPASPNASPMSTPPTIPGPISISGPSSPTVAKQSLPTADFNSDADSDAESRTPASRLIVSTTSTDADAIPENGSTFVRVPPPASFSSPSNSSSYIPPTNANVSPPTYYAPMQFTPDWASFSQVGVIGMTFLIGMFAGCSAVMLDEWRRRKIRCRAAVAAIAEK